MQRDLEEAIRSRDEAFGSSKDTDKRIKQLEGEVSTLREDVETAQRLRRQAEAELAELNEERNAGGLNKNALTEEKRRLDQRLAALEEELEDEKANSESAMERAKKATANAEQLTSDLATERANSSKLENMRALLEKQNKELKAKLAEVDAATKNKMKTTLSSLEARVQTLEQQLEAEQKEHQNAIKLSKRMEKKLKEMTTQVEEEHRHSAESKDQVSALTVHTYKCTITQILYSMLKYCNYAGLIARFARHNTGSVS